MVWAAEMAVVNVGHLSCFICNDFSLIKLTKFSRQSSINQSAALPQSIKQSSCMQSVLEPGAKQFAILAVSVFVTIFIALVFDQYSTVVFIKYSHCM